jgi:hypothetical protein
LAEVLQDAEKSDQRKALLEQIRTRSNALYQRVIELLEQDYFC